MDYGYSWLPPMIMRQPEPVRDLFEGLLYCTEISEPDLAEPGLAAWITKNNLERLQGMRRYAREARGYDLLMEMLDVEDKSLSAEVRLEIKQRRILEMVYRARKLLDERRAKEEADEAAQEMEGEAEREEGAE